MRTTVRCENDPICYQGTPRSRERCSYLTFGCRVFNEALDREVLYDFLLSRGVLAASIAPRSASCSTRAITPGSPRAWSTGVLAQNSHSVAASGLAAPIMLDAAVPASASMRGG